MIAQGPAQSTKFEIEFDAMSINRGCLIFFSEQSNFSSPNEHEKQYNHEWR